MVLIMPRAMMGKHHAMHSVESRGHSVTTATFMVTTKISARVSYPCLMTQRSRIIATKKTMYVNFE